MDSLPWTANSTSPTQRYKRKVLHFLTSFVPTTDAVFYTVNRRLDAVDHVFLRMASNVNVAYLEYFHRLDPFHPRLFAKNNARLVTVRDITAIDDFAQSEYLTKFFSPLGLFYEAELYLRDEERLIGGVSLLRSREARDFCREELRFLSRSHEVLQEGFLCCRRSDAATSHGSTMDSIQLSLREREVTELVLRGATNADISRTLFISLPTVKTHLQHIFAKAGVHSRTELAARLLA